MSKIVRRRAEILDEAAVYFSGLTMDEYFLDEKAFEKYWECGVKPLQLIFRDEKEHVRFPDAGAPAISYGHLAALGARINYPQDSQPNTERMFDSIGEGIKWLRRDRDFGDNGLFKRYVKYTDMLRNYFRDNEIKLTGLGWQGPVTSAVLLRGQDFYIDIYENPDEAKEFLKLITESVIKYVKFLRKVNGQPETDKNGSGVSDDFAALISPDMFEEFVIPYWKRHCEGTSSGGPRGLHCEGLCRQHLKFLDAAGFCHFQPSVSPKLTCQMLAKELKMPFDWLIPPHEFMMMSKEEIERWVDETVVCGPSFARTEMFFQTARQNGVERTRQFLNAFHKYDVKK